MNHKLFTTLSGLAISGVMLMTGLMATNLQGPRLAGVVDDTLLAETIETGAAQATDETGTPLVRKHRRGRASLSMPYFSFAQSLRTRG